MTRQPAANNSFSGLVPSDDLRRQFIESGWLSPIPNSMVRAHWILKGEQRLDAGYYGTDVTSAFRIIEDSRFEIRNLDRLTLPIFYPNRFKRVYAESRKDGTAFLKASEMLHFRPNSELFLSKKSKSIEICKVPPRTILVSRSGSVGRCVLVTDRLSKFVISDDALRVQVSDFPEGYIYAFLSSWIGQTLIVKDKYGSAIKHLEPHHIGKIPIPLIPKEEIIAIHEAILAAYNLREIANKLLDEADILLHKELGLSVFDKSQAGYLNVPIRGFTNNPPMPHPKAFSIRASDLEERFDGSYHVPTSRMAIRNITMGKFQPTQLKNLMADIFLPNRFKRVYVQKEYGVPFFQGSHLPLMRPYDLKYISKRANQKNISQCIIHEGQILITRSGTIGRVGLVTSYQEGWAASEHFIRLIPNLTKTHPGYITAFLLTQYGQNQLLAKTYGGVVDEITTDDTGQIWIPNAPRSIQDKIGNLVVDAYEKKNEANMTEETAIKQLESRLEEAAKFHNS